MINHVQSAQARGGSGAAQVASSADTGELFLSVRSGQFNLRRSQNLFLNRSHQVRVFVADTLPATATTTPGFSDIVLRASDPIQSFTLQLVLTNTDTKTNIILTPDNVVYFLSHVEVLANNGSSLLERIDADHLRLSYEELDPDAWQRVNDALLGTYQGAGSLTIAPGGRATVYIPILRSVVVQNELMSAGLVGPIHFRCWWRGSTWQNVSATAMPAITVASFQALAQTVNWDPSRAAQLVQRYMSGPRQDIRYAMPSFQRTTESLVAGQPFSLRLCGVQGLITSLVLLVRDLSVSVYQPMRVSSIDLLDASGASILGGSPIDTPYIRLVYTASQPIHYNPNSFWSDAVRIPVSGPDVAHAEMRGQVEAYIPMTGNHQLRFTPGDTGSYQVSVIVRSVAMLSIERGQVSNSIA